MKKKPNSIPMTLQQAKQEFVPINRTELDAIEKAMVHEIINLLRVERQTCETTRSVLNLVNALVALRTAK